MTSLKDFIAAYPVFRFDEAAAALPGTSPESLAAGLNYHVAQQHIRRLRRGLYARGHKGHVDIWLIGARLTSDAVIAYQSAIDFHDDADKYGCTILTRQRVTPFVYNEVCYRGVRLTPRSANDLKRGPRFRDGIVDAEREGLKFRVCTKERAYADCFDRVDLTSEGLEELADQFLAERDLDPRSLVAHALANGSRIAAARLGLFMQAHRKLASAEKQIDQLRQFAPKAPAIFEPDTDKHENCHLLPEWNAIIPEWVRRVHYDVR